MALNFTLLFGMQFIGDIQSNITNVCLKACWVQRMGGDSQRRELFCLVWLIRSEAGIAHSCHSGFVSKSKDLQGKTKS